MGWMGSVVVFMRANKMLQACDELLVEKRSQSPVFLSEEEEL
jgi:hypothetical protein